MRNRVRVLCVGVSMPLDALDRSLALVLWAENEAGEDDVVVYPGVLRQRGSAFVLERGEGESTAEIREEWLARIQTVPAEVSSVLCNCEYQLSLLVGKSEDVDGALESYGLRWPT